MLLNSAVLAVESSRVRSVTECWLSSPQGDAVRWNTANSLWGVNLQVLNNNWRRNTTERSEFDMLPQVGCGHHDPKPHASSEIHCTLYAWRLSLAHGFPRLFFAIDVF